MCLVKIIVFSNKNKNQLLFTVIVEKYNLIQTRLRQILRQ